jgi:hypothetical protein
MYKYQPKRVFHAVRQHSGNIGLFLFLAFLVYAKFYVTGHPHLERKWWLSLSIGVALLAFTVANMRSGSTALLHSTVRRFEDPVGFWTAVVTSGCLGLAGVCFGLGQLMGLWTR